MIRLQNLLPSATDATTTKSAEASGSTVAEAAVKARPAAAPAPAADRATAIPGRRDLAALRPLFERSAQQDTAVAGADVALDGLGKQRETLGAMRAVAVEATGADFASAFAAGKGLRAAFEELASKIDPTASATQLGGQGLADGSQPRLGAPVDGQASRTVALQATTRDALGLSGLSLGSRDDAAAAVKALDAAIAKVDSSREDVFQFREGVSKVAEAARRDQHNSGLLRNREEALAMADDVSRRLGQDGGDGRTNAARVLAQSVPSAQSVLSLLRSE
jgi:hypothetical protein